MPLPPPPAAGLTRIGKPIAAAPRQGAGVGLVRVVVARDDRDAERRGQPPRRRLVAHRPDRVGRRPDPADGRLRSTASAKAAFSARKPKPGWTASASAARAAATTAVDVEQVEGVGAVRRRDDRRRARAGRPCGGSGSRSRRGWRRTTAGSRRCRRRAGGVPVPVARSNATIASSATRHRPPTPPCRQRPVLDPALDGPRRRAQPRGDLAGRQFLGHRVAIVAQPGSAGTARGQAPPSLTGPTSNRAGPPGVAHAGVGKVVVSTGDEPSGTISTRRVASAAWSGHQFRKARRMTASPGTGAAGSSGSWRRTRSVGSAGESAR